MDRTAKIILSLVLDAALSTVMISGNYVYNYKIPHQLQPSLNIPTAQDPASDLFVNRADTSAADASSAEPSRIPRAGIAG